MKRISKYACGLALCMLLLYIGRQPVYALDFATFPLEELAENSNVILIGTVMNSKKAAVDNKLIYKVNVEQVIKGGDANSDIVVAQEDAISVKVLQWSDEGVLNKGKRYLFLLYPDSGIYGISGVHQGFILLENGTSASRYYSTDEVSHFLQNHDMDVTHLSANKNTVVESIQKDLESDETNNRIIIAGVILCISFMFYLIIRFKRPKDRR
ncbi:hypothetical protein FHS15_002355 [Paenibacillus castaneae]|uniref:hypothetical protein n=1 Tax=Paenibacillus castaneae TaxID=474957 RepID=UPI000C9998BF|nr:hypothetical protein [Paenibacillus castaneae]NIK77230.1 hypothetical protein [Paenibacillus castaneae]